MLSKIKQTLIVLASTVIFFSCKQKEYNGDGYVNYPDVNVIWNEHILPIQQTTNLVIKEVVIEGNRKDTLETTSDKINWEMYKNIIVSTNIYNENFDKQFQITMLPDTMAKSTTMYYDGLNHDNATKKMTFTFDSYTNLLQHFYIEYNHASFSSSESYKILFIKNKSLQIQEATKKPFKKALKQIRTLYFN